VTFPAGVRSLLAAVAALSAFALPATARAATTDLGPIGFGTVVIDDARAHVYVSGPTAGAVEVLDYSGNVVATIPNLPGASGLALSGRYLYVAETSAGAIARIDLDSGTYAATPFAAGLLEPHWLAITGSRVWSTVSTLPCCGWGALASVDLKSGRTKTFPQRYYSPDVAATPAVAGTLFVSENGLSPGAIHRVDVSPAKLRTVAENTFTDQSNIEGIAVAPDGTRVIPAAGSPAAFEELSAATLQLDGVVYPGDSYPSAVAVSPGRGGLLATGLANGYTSPDIAVYPIGNTTPIFTATTLTWNGTSNVLQHGLALTQDGSVLFAMTASDVYGTDTIFNSFVLP
jgi:hypothetical protein